MEKTKTFLDKAPKSFLQRFMKQDLSVMEYMACKGQNEYFCEHSKLYRICMKVESAHKNIPIFQHFFYFIQGIK